MRFFFHAWRDDHCFADETGLELPDLPQARTLAARALGEMAKDALYASADPVLIGIDIVGQSGAVEARLRLTFMADAEH